MVQVIFDASTLTRLRTHCVTLTAQLCISCSAVTPARSQDGGGGGTEPRPSSNYRVDNLKVQLLQLYNGILALKF